MHYVYHICITARITILDLMFTKACNLVLIFTIKTARTSIPDLKLIMARNTLIVLILWSARRLNPDFTFKMARKYVVYHVHIPARAPRMDHKVETARIGVSGLKLKTARRESVDLTLISARILNRLAL